MLVAVLVALLTLAPVSASATEMLGADDPAFTQALQDWLADDEEAALTAFSGLAQNGNLAARFLLGVIDRTPALQGAYLAHLPRDQRLRVMRAPGGISGRNWLTLAADLPLVAAYVDLWDIEAGPDIVARFNELGETRAAREALIVLAAREHPALSRVEPDQADTDVLYLLWQGADPERRAQIENLIPVAHPQRLLIGERIDARELDIWLATDGAAAPIAALCNAACPDAGETCRGAAYRALNSHNALLTLGTPSEALVSQADFLASPRGRGTVMRRILLATAMRGRLAMLEYVRGHSDCLADALQAEHQRFLPRIPSVSPTD